ncbi:hypothetical protein B0H21DRAFT_72395 [Amylocystis lapponica]|nr:hypothetical protein B0H21DRAFT_72395 [Amylocystis lapponica]
MPATPSSIIADALNSLSKATNLALATVEDQARGEVARANAEAADARRERDDALKSLHALQLEEKEWTRRVEGWKAVIDKSEMTVAHQVETIAHLRSEAQQWKAQLLRLEDASRQEIMDWKEQYMRAEQERCRLSSRINELVAEQLAWNTQANAAAMHPVTPRAPYPDIFEPSTASTSTKRASTSSNPSARKRTTSLVHLPPAPDNDDDDDSLPPVPRRAKASAGATPSKPSGSARPSSPARTPKAKNLFDAPVVSSSKAAPHTPARKSSGTATPGTHVIRRVHAVIEVPVKEEEDSSGEGFVSDESAASGTPYEPEPTRSPTKRTQKQSRSVGRGRAQAQARSEESDPEQERGGRQGGRLRRPMLADDDDLDELAMSPEDEGMQSYAVQRPVRPLNKTQRATAPARPTAKKRKLDGEAGNAGTRATTAKVARKK